MFSDPSTSSYSVESRCCGKADGAVVLQEGTRLQFQQKETDSSDTSEVICQHYLSQFLSSLLVFFFLYLILKLVIKEGDPFEVFISSTKIRYCYYNETQNILGNTYGMLVLQVRYARVLFCCLELIYLNQSSTLSKILTWQYV